MEKRCRGVILGKKNDTKNHKSLLKKKKANREKVEKK